MPPLALAETERQTIREMNPRLPIGDFGTLQQAVDDDAAPMAFTMVLLEITAGTAR